MPPMKQTTLRLSSTQIRQLEKLADKLQIDKANVIRLAITRLAEQEGLSRSPK
jgi:predicted transcriptional regulator